MSYLSYLRKHYYGNLRKLFGSLIRDGPVSFETWNRPWRPDF
jgi:hypothetical protein